MTDFTIWIVYFGGVYGYQGSTFGKLFWPFLIGIGIVHWAQKHEPEKGGAS